MAVLWYMTNEWFQFLGSPPTNHENIMRGRHSKEKPKDKLPVGMGFTPCKRQDEIFQTYTDQMLKHLKASLEDCAETALRRYYPWTKTHWNLFFRVAHLAPFMRNLFRAQAERPQQSEGLEDLHFEANSMRKRYKSYSFLSPFLTKPNSVPEASTRLSQSEFYQHVTLNVTHYSSLTVSLL